MKSTAELLHESPFFETFSPEDIEALAGHAVMRSVPARQIIVRENEPAEALYMIVAGKVRLSFQTSGASVEPRQWEDRQALIRTLIEPGRVIGWSALVEPYHCRATATTIEACGQEVTAIAREIATEIEALAEILRKHSTSLASKLEDFTAMTRRIGSAIEAARNNVSSSISK